MAGDLIPPPSPAGRPDREGGQGLFSESELLRTDAEHEIAQEEATPVEPAPSSRYRSRFGFLMGALLGLGLAAVVVVALFATGDEEVRQPPWSAWQPESEENDLRALEIAKFVSAQYRLDSGDQLVDVYAQPLEIGGAPLSVVVRSAGVGEGSDLIDVSGDSLLFVLRGVGPRGSIDEGKPSLERLRLVQREAYELALYAFKYVDGIDNVVAFLPPAPPNAPRTREQKVFENPLDAVTEEEGGSPLPAMLFRPGDLEASLEVPLAETFPTDPPRPSTISKAEVDTFASVAQLHAFSASVVADQLGGGILVLDRASQAERAQEQLRSTLKA
jgi:hypothetical protein